MFARPLSACMRFLLLLCCCLLVLVAAVLPAADARASATVAVAPLSIDQEVLLGQKIQTTITVQNNGASPLPLRVYEAAAMPTTNRRATGEVRPPLPEGERFDPSLRATFVAAPSRPQPFIIYLEDQADLQAAYQISDWRARGAYVYRTLIEHALQTQAGLTQQLKAQGTPFRSLWIVNAVVATGTLADAQAALARDDVALVRANHVVAVPDQGSGGRGQQTTSAAACSPSAPDEEYCWNVRKVRADATRHDFGAIGQGVVVANIDTGVALEHPALVGSYRGNQNNSFEHDYNWFDPNGTFELPQDDNGHGTHTMGTIVGEPVNNANGVGIAPGARWIAARGCENLYCSDVDLIASAQWMLAPTRINGTEPRPDLRPMIVNNSWSGGGDDQWYAPYTAAWRAAGMFPVFAAGNATGATRVCGSIASPADYPNVVGVGAVSNNDVIANFSLIGPARDGRIKPDVVAPGVGIYSTYPPKLGNYHTLSGTSMAAPHVAATVALLWSANPALIGDYETTYALLRDSAVPLDDARCGDGPRTPNNVYGFGRIDAYAAVERARVDVPWLSVTQNVNAIPTQGGATLDVVLDATAAPAPGVYQARVQLYSDDLTQPLQSIPVTLRVVRVGNEVTVSGRVVNSETGQPVQALLALSRGETIGSAISTDANGAFRLIVPETEGYEIVVTARSFITQRQPIRSELIEVQLQPDAPHLVLPDAPFSVSLPFNGQTDLSFPIENRGTRPLFYRVNIPPDFYVVERSDAPNGPVYNWIDLPSSATVLEAGDDVIHGDFPLGMTFPFYTIAPSDFFVTTDGMLTFEEPFSYRGPTTGCLPDTSLSFYTIAPLRLDLDTSRGGRVRYGMVDNQFVLSYEAVPLQNGTPDQVYTFQLVLHADGRIVFQYKHLGPLPNRVAAGIQRSPGDVSALGCGNAMRIYGGLALELRPQQSATNWLTTPARSGTLQPGERVDIPLRVRWVRPSPSGNLEGRVVITSNDPRQPSATKRVVVAPQPAPYELWLNTGWAGKR